MPPNTRISPEMAIHLRQLCDTMKVIAEQSSRAHNDSIESSKKQAVSMRF